MKRNAGIAPLIVIAVLAALAGTAWVVKPSLFGGASKRAANSTQATAQLEAAVTAQGSAAAASVAQIGEANSLAPESPAREFISREVPFTLSLLPAPNSVKLLEAERRRVAVMEGNLAEARRLYDRNAKDNVRLERDLAGAIAGRRAADLAVEQAAAAEHARTLQAAGAAFIALLLAAGWIYSRIYSITPAAIGKAAAEMRAGVSPIQALSNFVPTHLHSRVHKAAKLATELNG